MKWPRTPLPFLSPLPLPLPLPLPKPNSHHHSSPFSTSLSTELALTDQLHSILLSVSAASIPHYLDPLRPILTRHVISATLDSLPSASTAFSLFLWSTSDPRLLSGPSFDRMTLLLQHDPLGIDSAWNFLEIARKIGSFSLTPSAFKPIIDALSLSGEVERTVEAFERMVADFGVQPNKFVYNTVIKLFMDNGFFWLAMAIYNQMIKLNCKPSRFTYRVLINGLCNARMVKDATALFDEMLQRGLSPDLNVSNSFMSYLCGVGKVDDASSILNSMREKGRELDEACYNVLLSGYSKLERIDEAFQRLKSFEESGFILGLEGYSCLIDGLFKVGRFDQACNYFKQMLKHGVKPDVIVYTIMIKWHAKSGRIYDCFRLMNEMTRRGIVPDTFCYNTLIKALCDTGHLDRARSLRLEISKNEKFPDSATHTIVLCGLCNAGLVNEAHQIFDEMSKLGCRPTAVTFNSLINGLCKSGRVDEAQLLFYKMEMGNKPSLFLRLSQGTDRVRDSNSLRKLVDELCQSGQVLKAYKLLRGIIDSGVMPDIFTYNILIHGFCKFGNTDTALKLFKELQIKGHSPDVYTYCTLIDGLTRANRDEDVSVVFEHLMRTGCKPDLSIYNTMMKSLNKKRKVLQSVNLWLDHMSEECRLPNQVKTISLVRENFENGSLEEAIRGLIELDQERGSVSSNPYTLWIIGFCQAKRVDDAFRVFNVLREFDLDLTRASCIILIDRLSVAGELKSAIYVMVYSFRRKIVFEDKRVGNRLIKRLCLQNRKRAARALAWRMRLAGYNLGTYLHESTKNLMYYNEDFEYMEDFAHEQSYNFVRSENECISQEG